MASSASHSLVRAHFIVGGIARLGFQVTSEPYSMCPETGRPISHHLYTAMVPIPHISTCGQVAPVVSLWCANELIIQS